MSVFNLQPLLDGNLVRLRPLVAEDFDSLFAVSSDPLIWEQHPERNRYQKEVFERFFQGALDSKGALTVIDRSSGEIIGSSRFNALDLNQRSVEVGYTFLARKCWGKGHNTEMKKLMLSHAFEAVDRVFFFIGADNLRSRRAIEKIGAVLVEKFERQPKEGSKYFATKYLLEEERFRALQTPRLGERNDAI